MADGFKVDLTELTKLAETYGKDMIKVIQKAARAAVNASTVQLRKEVRDEFNDSLGPRPRLTLRRVGTRTQARSGPNPSSTVAFDRGTTSLGDRFKAKQVRGGVQVTIAGKTVVISDAFLFKNGARVVVGRRDDKFGVRALKAASPGGVFNSNRVRFENGLADKLDEIFMQKVEVELARLFRVAK